MPRPISTRIHGMLDYLTALVLIILPRLLNWSDHIILYLTLLGLSIILYSLFTRYELGVAKLLPVKAHLSLDAVGGLSLIVAAFMLRSNNMSEMIGLIVLGVFELGAVLLTNPSSNTTVHSPLKVYE